MPEEIKRLVFDRNWNNKLLCFHFLVIRPERDDFEVGERLDVRIEERHFCYATVSDVQILSLLDITDRNYNLLDSNLEKKEFMEFMEGMYAKKKWWNKYQTKMRVIFLKKIVQLDIFEQ
jgi:hypothetical protein